MAAPILLRAGTAEALIAPQGAELLQWRAGGVSLLWKPDARFWEAVSPILFPVVGWTRGGEIRVAGTAYPLGVHGFARHQLFRVREQRENSVGLELVDDDETRVCYPFRFALRVDYRLAADRLDVALHVENLGRETMPYAVGLHPGFRWPFCGGEKSDYRIRFAEEETLDVPVITADGLFAAQTRPIPLTGRDLPLSDALFAREALCFLSAKSRTLCFERPGIGSLSMSGDDFPHWALWSRPGAPFLSIEQWTGHGDPAGFAGDLCEKPSMRLLPAGGGAQHAASFAVTL